MRVLKFLALTIVSVALPACAGSSGPGSASTSRAAGPAFPAWMGDTNKTDVTPADRAARLSALKTDERAYLGNLQTSDWLVRNCQTGKIRISHTDLWRQEIAVVRKNKTLSAQLDLIEKTLVGRIKLLGGKSQACNIHFARGVNHQHKLFINVTGLPG